LAAAAIRTAAAFDKVGLEPVAIAGATFVYGIQFYRGVRQETGGAGDVVREYRALERGVALLRSGERGDPSAWGTLTEGIREDHRMIRFYAEKYDAREGEGDGAGDSGTGTGTGTGTSGSGLSLASDAVRKIGFQ